MAGMIRIKKYSQLQEIIAFLESGTIPEILQDNKNSKYKFKKRCERFKLVSTSLYHVDNDGIQKEFFLKTRQKRCR